MCLAGFVFARGCSLVNVLADPRGVVFTFVNDLQCRKSVGEFTSGPAHIDARLYAYALQLLETQATDVLMEFQNGEN